VQCVQRENRGTSSELSDYITTLLTVISVSNKGIIWKTSRDVYEFEQEENMNVINAWLKIGDSLGTGTAPSRFEYSDLHENYLVVMTEGECLKKNLSMITASIPKFLRFYR
jgi:hypothetical protein